MRAQNQVNNNFLVNAVTEYKIRPIHHVIFWSIYFMFNFLRWGSYFNDYIYSFKSNLLGFPIHITLSYFTIYFLIPRFLFKRKYISFIVILFLSILVMVTIKYLLTHFLISYNVWPEGPETYSMTLNFTVVMMLGELYVITFVASFKFTMDYLRETRKASRLEKEQLETELRFLRAQISPHFFFNTLNNIYSLSLEKSDKTPDTIIKLSDLMRYVLYETKENNQSLRKEIIFINNYLDLEKMRYNENLQLDFKVTGESKGKKIAPLLLVQFIENAFKHGANKSIGKVKIGIDVHVEEKFLYFRVGNTKPKNPGTIPKKSPGGIGLSNVEKRLKLRYGEDEYKLSIHEELDEYVVNLMLKLR
ncbi:sensor histidine kinase [Flagellimonas aequoris]|uniref:Sensor histidine kinase n=1 Tax=Flagellimonas aequoris TaxID=2306997 RepID=A0A418N7R5_9FLAO|nr:histidine kinase [Allomuricauda aequoris]RIV71165.1 sensor histidine kinase [Allomuricauda aequoris]TXK02538.1 sensor histidine kinase [Allomuricauda aequoris]